MKTLSEDRWYSRKQLIQGVKILLFYTAFWLTIAAVLLIISLAFGWGTDSTYDSWPEPY